MRAFLAALVVMAAIAFGANYALERAGFSTAERTASSAVRLD